MDKSWKLINNTKDDVIAGLVSSIVILCHYRDAVPVSNICDHVGIRMSTVHTQVKKFFEKLKIEGFQSLIKSADLLPIILQHLEIQDQ